MATDALDCRRFPRLLAYLYYYLFRLLVTLIPDPQEIDTLVDILDDEEETE